MYPKHIQVLIDYFSKLPGVGAKTAAKYVFSLLNWNKNEINNFIQAISELNKNIHFCGKCFNYSNSKICSICSDKRRDHSVICVVTSYPDLLSIEALKEYNGVYHILRGNINPIQGIEPKNLTIDVLLKRVKNENIKEVILALNPDIPGETTSLYLKEKLKKYPNLKITRIAKGLPMGATLEYADQTTILNALKGRTELK